MVKIIGKRLTVNFIFYFLVGNRQCSLLTRCLLLPSLAQPWLTDRGEDDTGQPLGVGEGCCGDMAASEVPASWMGSWLWRSTEVKALPTPSPSQCGVRVGGWRQQHCRREAQRGWTFQASFAGESQTRKWRKGPAGHRDFYHMLHSRIL